MPYIFACSGTGVLRRMEELPLALSPLPSKEVNPSSTKEGVSQQQVTIEGKQIEKSQQLQLQLHQQQDSVVEGKEAAEGGASAVDGTLVQEYQNKNKHKNKDKNQNKSNDKNEGTVKDDGKDKGQGQGQDKEDDFWSMPIHPGLEMTMQLKSSKEDGEEEEEEEEDKEEADGSEGGLAGVGYDSKNEPLSSSTATAAALTTTSSSSASALPSSSSSSSSSSEEVFVPLRHSYSLSHLAVIDSYDFRWSHTIHLVRPLDIIHLCHVYIIPRWMVTQLLSYCIYFILSHHDTNLSLK